MPQVTKHILPIAFVSLFLLPFRRAFVFSQLSETPCEPVAYYRSGIVSFSFINKATRAIRNYFAVAPLLPEDSSAYSSSNFSRGIKFDSFIHLFSLIKMPLKRQIKIIKFLLPGIIMSVHFPSKGQEFWMIFHLFRAPSG